MMDCQLDYVCDAGHKKREDCPDVAIVKTKDGYGLPIRDGGSSFYEISFCPFCGEGLVKSE